MVQLEKEKAADGILNCMTDSAWSVSVVTISILLHGNISSANIAYHSSTDWQPMLASPLRAFTKFANEPVGDPDT